jgi:hypothetical protein
MMESVTPTLNVRQARNGALHPMGMLLTCRRFQRAAVPRCVPQANTLIFKPELSPAESFRHARVAQPSSTACVFFAQHLPEIGPIGL